MTDQAETFEIPVERLPELQKKLDSLNKKALKNGVPPIQIEVGERFERDAVDGAVECYRVKVEGEAPVLNGWQFIATLEHDEDGTIIRRLPTFGREIDLSQYRDATPDNCDHCGYKRRRNDTYIVAHEDGTTKQVGSNCLKDFTGHESPQAIARQMEAIRDLFESIRGGEYHEGRVIPRFPVIEYMTHVHAMIRENGWTSKARAWDAGDKRSATAYQAESNMTARRHSHDHVALVNDDMYAARKVIDWATNLDDEKFDNDYFHNLHVALKGETLRGSQFGWAASAFQAYEKEQKGENGSDFNQHVDEWAGNEGERRWFVFKVKATWLVEPREGDPFNKHVLVDDRGRTLIWLTSKDLKQGGVYRAKFTIKNQDTHPRWGRQTQVTRPSGLTEMETNG